MSMSFPESPRTHVYALCTFCLLAALIVAIHYAGLPPSPVPASAPPNVFSAERAIQLNKELITEPHPGASFGEDRLRDKIKDHLEKLGVETQIYDVTRKTGGRSLGAVQDIVARIPGTHPSKSIVFMAHYDSVFSGLGASDDAAGCVVMLELAKILKAEAPMKNDIIFVFTCDEEVAGNGVRAFCEQHPWGKNVGVLLNFEARGTRGNSYMFETSPQNGWIIEELTKSHMGASANSLMFDVYKRTPFGTDFTTAKNAGMRGYNVAYVGNFAYYHTINDSPENMSLSSLQQHGNYGIGVARHFGNMEIGNVDGPDAIYFNTIGTHMVCYPASWGRYITVAAVLVAASFLVYALATGTVSVSGFALGFLAWLLAAALSVAVNAAFMFIAWKTYYFFILYSYLPYSISGIAIALAAFAFVYGILFRKVSPLDLASAGLAIYAIGAIVIEIYFPLASYASAYPLLCAAAGLCILAKTMRNKELSPSAVMGTTFLALPAMLMGVPGLRALLDMTPVLFAPLVLLVLTLLLTLLIPQFMLIMHSRRWLLPVVSALVGVLFFAAGYFGNGPSAKQPILNSLDYGIDADAGKAYWFTSDKKTDEWTSQFLNKGRLDSVKEFVDTDRQVLKAEAPMASIPLPNVEVVSSALTPDGLHDMKLKLTAPGKPAIIRIGLTSPQKVKSAVANGYELEGADSDWSMSYDLFTRTGTCDITLKIQGDGPLVFKVKQISREFIDVKALGFTPRPDYMATKPNVMDFFEKNPFNSGYVFVTKSFRFD